MISTQKSKSQLSGIYTRPSFLQQTNFLFHERWQSTSLRRSRLPDLFLLPFPPPLLLGLFIVPFAVATPARPCLHGNRHDRQADGGQEQAPQRVLVALDGDGLVDAAQASDQSGAAEQAADELGLVLTGLAAAAREAAGEGVGEQAGEDAAANGGAEGAGEAAEGGDERGEDEVGGLGREVQGVDEGVVDGGAGGEAVEEGEQHVQRRRRRGAAGQAE